MKTKLKAANLDTISLDDYKKEFIRLMKMAPQKCAGPDQALWFFIKQNHQFPDGTVHPLILLSQTIMPWQVLAKAAVKSDKKYCLLGTAYYELLPDGKGSLQILAEKGDAKIAKVAKAAKGILNKTGIALVLTNPTTKEAIVANESTEEPESRSEPTIEQRTATAQNTFANFTSLMKKLGIDL